MTAPTSTYRLQFGPHLDFAAATELVSYLARLGVGALYASPLLQAAPGSTHGYDVADPTRASAELGGEPGRSALAKRLRSHGLGLVVDVVPNHMSTASPWWSDVLAHGRESEHAKVFDIEWEGEKLNGYRRFFDIDSLAAVRIEDPEVFEATHAEVLRWVGEGEVTGLRVDHPDGLSDPGGYLQELRANAPDAWIVAEKILAPGESLPTSWPIEGTTGYDALREICGVFVDPGGAPILSELCRELTGYTDPQAVEHDCKRLLAATTFSAEVRRIARLGHDERLVVELLAGFDVYRSYLPEHQAALERTPPAARPIVDAMLADPRGELATRVQQTSGMVMAKGVEDTAYYRYNRFVALNEVGGDPARFGADPAELHALAAAREAGSPSTMTTLSTHDTKRSEDVRARLAVLAELPDEFAAAVRQWTSRRPLPEPTLDLLGWQTAVGAWPLTAERLGSALVKSAREAKLATSWTDPDSMIEAQIVAWARETVGDPEVAEFANRITPYGWSNSLGQKAVQLAGPGVPDVYQGTELWDHSLVDPDNRRPVDFAVRRELLDRLDTGWLPPIDETGAAKLLVVSRVLRLRRERPELFHGYSPLRAEGAASAHVVAFARAGLVAVATRLPVGLARRGGPGDTILPLPPGGGWSDALTGRPCDSIPRVADLTATYPVAILVR